MMLKIHSNLFALFVGAVFAQLAWGFQPNVHPECQLEPADGSPIFEHIQDISALLHGADIPTSVCIFNPSVTRLQGDIFLWAARAYKARLSSFGCKADPTVLVPSLTNDGWRGSNSLVLAVTQTAWSPDGGLNHTLINSTMVDVELEDGRLFKDGDGSVWLLAHSPQGGFMTVAPVEVHCVTPASGDMQCELGLGGSRVLWFTDMRKVEKNWVPHDGSSRMSYPIFPSFAPHSVLDFGSYHEPLIKSAFDSVASNESFFADIRQLYDGVLEFAGSTPAVLYDDGVSYLAVGHVRAMGVCFHDPANQSAIVRPTCEALADSKFDRRSRVFFQFLQEGRLYPHHYKEYAFFFYRFLAKPPYEITHMSFGLIPCAYYHSGVTFPAGLERIGPNGTNYLISYGEANRYSRLLTISAANVRKVLMPMEQMRLYAKSYTLCSVPC